MEIYEVQDLVALFASVLGSMSVEEAKKHLLAELKRSRFQMSEKRMNACFQLLKEQVKTRMKDEEYLLLLTELFSDVNLCCFVFNGKHTFLREFYTNALREVLSTFWACSRPLSDPEKVVNEQSLDPFTLLLAIGGGSYSKDGHEPYELHEKCCNERDTLMKNVVGEWLDELERLSLLPGNESLEQWVEHIYACHNSNVHGASEALCKVLMSRINRRMEVNTFVRRSQFDFGVGQYWPRILALQSRKLMSDSRRYVNHLGVAEAAFATLCAVMKVAHEMVNRLNSFPGVTNVEIAFNAKNRDDHLDVGHDLTIKFRFDDREHEVRDLLERLSETDEVFDPRIAAFYPIRIPWLEMELVIKKKAKSVEQDEDSLDNLVESLEPLDVPEC